MNRARVFILLLLLAGCHKPSPAVAPASQWGPPEKSIRVISFNVQHCDRGRDKVVKTVQDLAPDVIFMQEVRVEDAEPLGKALGFYHAFRKHENFPGEGVAMYSKYPLTQVQAVLDKDGRACALFADVSVQGKQFTLVSVHLQATQQLRKFSETERNRGAEIALIKETWVARGSHPILIGGDFNQIPSGRNYALMKETFTDALARLGHTRPTLGEGMLRARVDYFLHSGAWTATDGGVGPMGVSDHRPIWIDARKKS